MYFDGLLVRWLLSNVERSCFISKFVVFYGLIADGRAAGLAGAAYDDGFGSGGIGTTRTGGGRGAIQTRPLV